MKLSKISVTHLWTKESLSVEVTRVTPNKIEFRWSLSGIYTLDLATNVVKGSAASRKKNGPFVMWQASDIAAVRKLVKEHFAESDDLALRMAAHEASKP